MDFTGPERSATSTRIPTRTRHAQTLRQRGRVARTCFVIALALAFFTGITRDACAHDTSVAYLTVEVRGQDVAVEARLHGDDLGVAVGGSPLDRPTRARALSRQDAVTRYVASKLSITQDGRRCELAEALPAEVVSAPDGAFRLVVRYRARCPRVLDSLSLRDDLFFDIDDNHRAFARIRAFGVEREKVFGVYDRRFESAGDPGTLAVVRQYLHLGVEHIVTGYDHLAFLLALLCALAAKGTRAGLRPALAVVTAFTLAHSITLGLAAVGAVRPSPRIVESAIALSIALVAAADLRAALRRSSSDSTDRALPALLPRALAAFAFGTIHGLGFAGALGELGLPRNGLLRALAAFNVGVELGQLALASAAFPLLGWASARLGRAGRSYDRAVLAPVCAALVALGLYWFSARVRG
jgi:hypothetical protein